MVGRTTPRPAAAGPDRAPNPALAAYLNQHLATATSLIADLRRTTALPELSGQQVMLRAVRRDVVADRASLRMVMRDLGIATDWSVLGTRWVAGNASRLRPVLSQIPALDWWPMPSAERGGVHALLDLENLAADLRRRAAAWRILAGHAEKDARLRRAAFTELTRRGEKQALVVEEVAGSYAATLFASQRLDSDSARR